MRSIAWRRSASAANATPVALEPSGPLDPHAPRPVDHHLVDGRVLQQRLERTEAERPLRRPAATSSSRVAASSTRPRGRPARGSVDRRARGAGPAAPRGAGVRAGSRARSSQVVGASQGRLRLAMPWTPAAAVARRAGEQADLAREGLGRGQVDGLAGGDAQGGGDAGARRGCALASPPGARGQDLDVLQRERGRTHAPARPPRGSRARRRGRRGRRRPAPRRRRSPPRAPRPDAGRRPPPGPAEQQRAQVPTRRHGPTATGRRSAPRGSGGGRAARHERAGAARRGHAPSTGRRR